MTKYSASLFVTNDMEMVMTTTLMVPPAYSRDRWPKVPQPPYHNKGLKCPYEVVAGMVVPVSKTRVELLGTKVKVTDGVFTAEAGEGEDATRPVSFVATGKTYRYKVSIWQNRVVIEVWPSKGKEPLSVMFPETKANLSQVFGTIASDCSS